MSNHPETLSRLTPGMIIPYGGDRLTRVTPALAEAFRPGDALVTSQTDGEILHIRAETRTQMRASVERAHAALPSVRAAAPAQLELFFTAFADRLAQDRVWRDIEKANHLDVARAIARGRETEGFGLKADSRDVMIEGLRAWIGLTRAGGEPADWIDAGVWSVVTVRPRHGVVGFAVDEPVTQLVDVSGVVATGDTAVVVVGEDAAGTAEAITEAALAPALADARLPPSAVGLSSSHGPDAAWALFTDSRLALAVARGSVDAVRRLGEVASLAGVPMSLRGFGRR